MFAKKVDVCKYLELLEQIKLRGEEIQDEGGRKRNDEAEIQLQQNVTVLQNFVKESVSDVFHQNANSLNINVDVPSGEIADLNIKYSVYLEYILLNIVGNVDMNSESKQELISTRQINLIIKAIQDLSYHVLEDQKNAFLIGVVPPEPPGTLQCSLSFFEEMLAVKQFHVANSMEKVTQNYMAAIFSLLTTHYYERSKESFQQKLNNIWLTNKFEYFRNLMIFKGNLKVNPIVQRKLHQELLQKLASKDGFTTFVAVLQAASEKQQEDCTQKNAEIIANIVTFPGHSQRYQTTMIKQVFSFLIHCIRNKAIIDHMGIGLLTLRRFYDLNEENRKFITQLVFSPFKKLSQPEDVITGLIIMEHTEFCELISLFYQLFYASSVECLPSELLVNYLPMLLEVYYNLPDNLAQKQQIADIVARCLNNRNLDQLKDIVYKLYMRNFDTDWQTLQERIIITPVSNQTEICIKIASPDYKQDFSISMALPTLLMQANYAILSYQIFMALMELMSNKLLVEKDSELDVNLLDSEEELIALLNSKYPVKVEIVLSLNTLIYYESLKSQIVEHSQEFLKFLRQLIEQRINQQTSSQNSESTDQILLIMLTLSHEFLAFHQFPEEHRTFLPSLQKLREHSPNLLVQQQADNLIALLSGKRKTDAVHDTAFNAARSLLESHESHLQVCGIQMLLDLLQKRDEATMANGHVIVALALSTLKNTESYTFLNCVRLFVALVKVMETEVLEILSDEYLNENCGMDFRLVVGETILKVSQELGPLCYKYKNTLLNMFMHGARSSNDEFRMSSFSNLAQLCRTLSYQVLNFFQELLHLIDCELSTGKYLPAKRAALLVLSELLEGIENLVDFEELLLPVYRLLKLIAHTETCDEQMRTHAINGLKALSVKCKQFLFPKEVLQKEIRIFGIKDEIKPGDRKSKHILEIS